MLTFILGVIGFYVVYTNVYIKRKDKFVSIKDIVSEVINKIKSKL